MATSIVRIASMSRGFQPDARGFILIDDTDLFNEKLRGWKDLYNLNRTVGGLDVQKPTQRPGHTISTSA